MLNRFRIASVPSDPSPAAVGEIISLDSRLPRAATRFSPTRGHVQFVRGLLKSVDAAEGDRHIFRPSKGQKMSQSPARKRLLVCLVVYAL